MKKNIIIINRFYPLPSGRTTFTKDIIQNLDKDFNFKIICFDNGFQGKNIVKIEKKFKNNLPNILRFYKETYKELKKIKEINLVIGTGLSALGGMIYSKINKIPSVFNTSGIRGKNINEKISYKDTTQEKIKKRKLKHLPRLISFFIFDRLSIKLANKITIPTIHLKNQIRLNNPFLFNKIEKKLRVIIEGLNKKRLKKIEKEEILKKHNIEKNKIILFSRVENEKFFNKTIEEIKNKIPSSTIVKIESEKVKVEKDREFVESKLSAKEAMQISDMMFCIPSSEPHSSTVLEAIYFRCPTFVSDVGWLKHEFNDFNDFKIDVLSSKRITEKILNFCKDEEKYIKKFQILRKKILEKNNFDKTIEEYKHLINNLTNRTI
tara:strand:- start:2569 stop:3702 length:1134 start_codon:yes stop_codon:yes gene_type:complete